MDSFAAVIHETYWLLANFWGQMGNSFFIGVAVCFLTLAIGSLTAFAIGRLRTVQADHGHLAQIPPGHVRRGDSAVPCLDQVPYVTAGFRPGLADPGQGRSVASGQCPPCRRV